MYDFFFGSLRFHYSCFGVSNWTLFFVSNKKYKHSFFRCCVMRTSRLEMTMVKVNNWKVFHFVSFSKGFETKSTLRNAHAQHLLNFTLRMDITMHFELQAYETCMNEWINSKLWIEKKGTSFFQKTKYIFLRHTKHRCQPRTIPKCKTIILILHFSQRIYD